MASKQIWESLEENPRYTDPEYKDAEHVNVLEDGTNVIMMQKESVVNVYVGTITMLQAPVNQWGQIRQHQVEVELVEEGVPCKHHITWSFEETPAGNPATPGSNVFVPDHAIHTITREQYELLNQEGKDSPGALLERYEFPVKRPQLHSKVLFTGPAVEKHSYHFGTITGSRKQRMSGFGRGGYYAAYDVTTTDGNVFKNVSYSKVKRAHREDGGAAVVPAGGLQKRVHKIRTALNITVPAEQLFNVVTEANSKLGLNGHGTLPEQIAEVERTLFYQVSSSFADICIGD